jgi:predicted nucleotidyltransferase/predicted house-cleaning noncanonical NTP pyrophosphatase (MazG superfamily)
MSILDDPKKTLDPRVWDIRTDPPQILPAVEASIRKGAIELLEGVPAKQAFVVGSLTGYRYTEDSDLDVSIVVSIKNEEILEELRDRTKEFNEHPAAGTKHPINYYVLSEEEIKNTYFERFDAAYDLIGKKWVKPPNDVGVDLFAVYDQFKGLAAQLDEEKAEALRSIFDIEMLRQAYNRGGDPRILRYKLMRRYKDLDQAIEDMVATYEDVHQERLLAFKRYLDLAAIGIQEAPSPNLLPENIRYKMLERYSYLKLLVQLKNILGDEQKVETPEQRREARDALEGKSDKAMDAILIKIIAIPEIQEVMSALTVAVDKALYWRRKDGTIWTHQDPGNIRTKIIPFDASKHRGRKELDVSAAAKKHGIQEEHIHHALALTPKDLDWVFRQMKGKQFILPEDSDKVRDVLEKFNKLKNSPRFAGSKDINQYKSFHDLKKVTDEAFGKGEMSKKEEVEIKAVEGSKSLGKSADGKYEMIQIDTVEASAKLAHGTEWCVRDPKWAKRYLQDAPLYMITKNGKPFLMYHAGSNEYDTQLKNPADEEVELVDGSVDELLKKQGLEHSKEVLTLEGAKKSKLDAIRYIARTGAGRVPELEQMFAKTDDLHDYVSAVLDGTIGLPKIAEFRDREDRQVTSKKYWLPRHRFEEVFPKEDWEDLGLNEENLGIFLATEEDILHTNDPWLAHEYVKSTPKVSEKLESLIAEEAGTAAAYADQTGKRFEKGEKAIAKDSTYAREYIKKMYVKDKVDNFAAAYANMLTHALDNVEEPEYQETLGFLFRVPKESGQEDAQEVTSSIIHNSLKKIGSDYRSAMTYVKASLQPGVPFPEGEDSMAERVYPSINYAKHIRRRFYKGEPNIKKFPLHVADYVDVLDNLGRTADAIDFLRTIPQKTRIELASSQLARDRRTFGQLIVESFKAEEVKSLLGSVANSEDIQQYL